MTYVQRIEIDDSKYDIILPDKATDYIQRRIAEQATPYELSMLRDMARRLSSRDLVLDVGANIGNHTLYLAAVVGCRVHAFEPNNHLCKALKKSLVRNKLATQAHVHCVGVGKERGKAHFENVDKSNLGAQSLAIGVGNDNIIDIIPLDDIDFNQPVAAIKIDVEGMELAVLEGAAKLINRDHPILYVECQREEDFAGIQTWLASYAYTYWETFNVTPTHLFIPSSCVSDAQRVERLMAKVVRDEYRLQNKVSHLRFTLDQANEKYRFANEQIASLKDQLHSANLKYREASATLVQLKQDAEAQHALHDKEIALQKAQTDAIESQLKDRLAAAEQHKLLLEQQIKESGARYRSAQDKIHQLETQYSESQQAIGELKARAAELKDQLHSANLKYREASATLVQLKQDAEAQHALHDKEIALQKAQNDAIESQLKDRLAAAEQHKLLLEQQIKESGARYRSAQDKIHQLETQYSESQQAIGELKAHAAELKDQLHSANLKYRQASSEVVTLKTERSVLHEQIKEIQSKYRTVTQQLNTLRRSRAHAAATYVRQARRSWTDAAKLVWRLPRLLWRGTPLGVRPQGGDQTPIAPVYSPSEDSLPASVPRTASRRTRVAAIMDDFTYFAYQPECELHQLTPTGWEAELEACQPELLFIESAWRGKDALWGSKVGHTSNELQGIVAWCRKQGIPTVFWNKEDPVHFETFLNTARLFDFVFTTDIDCIHRYKAALEHDQVFLLPFACQPAAHNPIQKYKRKDAFCFAGAYYVRYPERTRDLEDFVRELPSFRPLEIYDRNYGKDDPNYQFPEAYQPYIVGTLPFDQIDKAYKGYRYAINLNSIKQSQTMFARRVFELLGSNTLVVSNYSRGVRLMFGDVVITSDSGAEIKRRLEVLEKENRTDRLRLAGLRKLMLEHTYGERIAYVLSKVTGREITQPLPSFKVLAAADTLEDVQRLVAHVQAQTGIDASLTVMLASGLSGAEVRAAVPEPTCALELLYAEDVQGKTLAELADGACWVAGMVADDYYGPHYLLDIALATRYSDAQAIGKGAWYAWQQGQCALNDPDATYRPAPRLTARRSAITCALAEDIDATQWLTKLSEWTYEYSQQLAIDPYNYCADAIQGEPAQIREIVDDLPAHHGISLQELIGIAETIPPMQHQEIDTPYFNGRELAHLLSGRPFVLHTNHEALSTEEQVDETIHLSRNQAIDAVLSGSTLQIRSELPDGKHEYLYSPVELDCNELLARLPESTDRKLPIHFELEPGLNLSLVVLFLNADKNRIGHVIEQPNGNCSIDLPDDAAYLRFGLRIYAGGAARIKRLLLGHLDHEPQVVLGQSDVLLLTNHYPSYDHLYRNGFVHSRVRGYREHGVHVDVFRLRENQPIEWHEFQDIDATTGSQEALRRLLASGRYRHVLVHFLDPSMWAVLKDFIDTIPVTTWVHGAEIHPWYRRKFNIQTPEQEQAARAQSEQRMDFWRGLLQPMPANLKLVFVSRTFSEEVMEDLGFQLPETSTPSSTIRSIPSCLRTSANLQASEQKSSPSAHSLQGNTPTT
jgi:FkbM family methyltransferase